MYLPVDKLKSAVPIFRNFVGLSLALMLGAPAFAAPSRNTFIGECRQIGGEFDVRIKEFHLVVLPGQDELPSEVLRFSVWEPDDATITLAFDGSFLNPSAYVLVDAAGQNPITFNFGLPVGSNKNSVGFTTYLPRQARIRCGGTLTRE